MPTPCLPGAKGDNHDHKWQSHYTYSLQTNMTIKGNLMLHTTQTALQQIQTRPIQISQKWWWFIEDTIIPRVEMSFIWLDKKLFPHQPPAKQHSYWYICKRSYFSMLVQVKVYLRNYMHTVHMLQQVDMHLNSAIEERHFREYTPTCILWPPDSDCMLIIHILTKRGKVICSYGMLIDKTSEWSVILNLLSVF